MSVDVKVIEFEKRQAHLSDELANGPPFTVHGIALGADDVTRGASGIKKMWPADELQEAADTLEGTNLVEDHENESRGVIGEVTKAGYKEGVGVLYEAELFDEDLAEKISNGLLEVSVRGFHKDVDEMDEHSETGAKIVEDIEFDNLSIVPTGASPSNTIEMGEHDELSAAELSAYVSTLQEDEEDDSEEEAEIEPGMWVEWADGKGITISQIEDGEIEVDVYEEFDGKWRSTGETTMISVDSLTEWDVDEEEDIGAREEDEDDDSDEEEDVSDEEKNAGAMIPKPEDAQLLYPEQETAENVGEQLDIPGSHSHTLDGDEWYMPGEDHDVFVERMKELGEMEMLADLEMALAQHGNSDEEDSDEELASEGDKVQWDDGAAQGVIVDRKTDGCFSDRIDGDHEICADDDDPVVLIEIVKDGERQDTMVAHKESTVSSADFEMSVDPPEFSEGDMVQWSVNPNMFGKVVHNPDNPEVIMVEVMEMMDGEMKPTGHTLTAAPPDLQKMDESEMASEDELQSFDDYPDAAQENAQMALDAREETDNPNDCGTDVGWKRANQLVSGESLSEDVVAKMASFNRHRQNSDQSDDEGRADCGWMMWKAWGGDEGVDWAMEKMDSMEEAGHRGEGEEFSGEQGKENQPWRYPDVDGDTDPNEPEDSGVHEDLQQVLEGDIAELQQYEMHTPGWSGTTESEWDSPDMEDFDTDDLEEIGMHFLISQGGFPAENFGELKLPVVEPNGDLNLNALEAVKGGRGVSAVDGLSDDMEERIVDWVNETANEEFDKSWGEEENAVTSSDSPSDSAEPTHKMDPEMEDDHEAETMSPVDASLDLINLFLRQNGKNERDSVDKMLSWLFSSTDVPTEKMELFRTASNAFLDTQGGADSFDAVDVESFRDWLLTQGGQTDDGVHARPTEPTPGSGTPRIATPVHVLSGDDLRSAMYSGASKKGSNPTQDISTMTNIEEQLEELDEPVAVEKEDFESLQEKADRFEDMSENLEALRERTEVLDSVDREQVDELAESDDPVVLESSDYEELTAEAEQVKQVYADTLSDEGPFTAEELTDKFSIEELREKYEDAGHDIEEELEAEPRSGDVDEEELEERAEEEQQSEEELQQEEAIEEKQAELRQKILSN